MTSKFEDLMYLSGLTAQGSWDTFDLYDKTAVLKFADLVVESCRAVLMDVYQKTPLELCGPLLTADENIAQHFYGIEQ